MVMELRKTTVSADNYPRKMPDLMHPPCSSRSSCADSKLNVHAPEFIPTKFLISAQKYPLKTAGLQQLRENRPDEAARNPPSRVYACVRPFPSVGSENSPSALGKPAKNQGVSRAEILRLPAEAGRDHEDLRSRILKQVEFYFSDANLGTDNYLMKLLRKDPEGFVSISVVSSFPKIKILAKNHGVVAAALKASSYLELSKDGKKIKRMKSLPDMDSKEVQGRTVIAENFPEDHSTEHLTQLFRSVGIVQMVWICQPEMSKKHPTLDPPKTDMLVSNKLHALVVYECVTEAETAVTNLTDGRNWRTGLRVRLLLRQTISQTKIILKGKRTGLPACYEGSDADEDSGSSGGSPDKSGDEQAGVDTSPKSVRGESINNGVASSDWRRGKYRDYGWGRGRGQLNGRYWSNGAITPQNCAKLGDEVLGRRSLGPRMPDGTRGFTFGRGKI